MCTVIQKTHFIHLLHLCTCNCNKFAMLHLRRDLTMFVNYDQLICKHSKKRSINGNASSSVNAHLIPSPLHIIWNKCVLSPNCDSSLLHTVYKFPDMIWSSNLNWGTLWSKKLAYDFISLHCVKSARIRSFPGPNFLAFGPERLRIRTLFTQCWLRDY